MSPIEIYKKYRGRELVSIEIWDSTNVRGIICGYTSDMVIICVKSDDYGWSIGESGSPFTIDREFGSRFWGVALDEIIRINYFKFGK